MSEIYTYYLVFRPADKTRLRWWHRPFVWRRGFEHVDVLMQLGTDVLFISSGTRGLWFKRFYAEDSPGDFVDVRQVANIYVADAKNTVLEYKSLKEDNILNLSFAVPTCVTVAKTVIGCRGWSITPYQLYKRLLKEGAIEMVGDKPDTSAQEAELQRQRKEAEAEKNRLAKERKNQFLQQRQGKRGRRSLIANLGGEQGTSALGKEG